MLHAEYVFCRGLIGALALGLVFCAEHLRDTLFVRPHPALWRFVTGCGLFYAMALAFALFQSLPDLRAIMGYLDPKHSGHALPEKSYGEDCSFTWENVKVGEAGRETVMVCVPMLCHRPNRSAPRRLGI